MKRAGLFIGLVIILGAIGYYSFFRPVDDGILDQELIVIDEISTDQIIAQCIEAMGGEDIINGIKNLRVVQDFPDHAGLQTAEIERPNKVRLNEYVAFDGEKAAILAPFEMVPEEEWKDFELDIAWYIPAFLEYPAEYIGTIQVEDIELFQIEVYLPLGVKMTYLINKETGLIDITRADVTLYGEEHSPQREFSNYREVDGVMFPHAFTFEGRTGVVTVTVESVEFNIDLEGRFDIPE